MSIHLSTHPSTYVYIFYASSYKYVFLLNTNPKLSIIEVFDQFRLICLWRYMVHDNIIEGFFIVSALFLLLLHFEMLIHFSVTSNSLLIIYLCWQTIKRLNIHIVLLAFRYYKYNINCAQVWFAALNFFGIISMISFFRSSDLCECVQVCARISFLKAFSFQCMKCKLFGFYRE